MKYLGDGVYAEHMTEEYFKNCIQLTTENNDTIVLSRQTLLALVEFALEGK